MKIRWNTIRILLGSEWVRLWKNPSAIMLLGLLVALSLLLASSDYTQAQTQAAKPSTCWIVYWQNGPWVEHLRQQTPKDGSIRLLPVSRVPRIGNRLQYPAGDSAIELHPVASDSRGTKQVRIHYRYSGKDPNVLWPYTRWFWRETTEHFGNSPRFAEELTPIGPTRGRLGIEDLSKASVSDLMNVELVGTVMLFIVQFFACCHLLVSLTSRDRERGTLMALALSPTSTSELLIARFLFHLMISLGVCAIILSILKPAALMQPVLWAVVTLASLGLMAIGTIIASLSKSQTTAGLLTLCYMLVTGVVFYLGSRYSAFGWIKYAMLEHYSLPLMYLTMKHNVGLVALPTLMSLTLLTAVWIGIAASLFRKLGWR